MYNQKFISIKVKAYPNKIQKRKIKNNIDMCHKIYNILLKEKYKIYNSYKDLKEKYSSEGKTLDMKNYFKSNKTTKTSYIRKIDPQMKEADSIALMNEEEFLTDAFIKSCSGIYRLPKYKHRRDKKSYTTNQINNNIRIEGKHKKSKYLRLPKIGFVKIRGFRKICCEYEIARVTVSKEVQNKYYCTIMFKNTNLDIETKNVKNDYVCVKGKNKMELLKTYRNALNKAFLGKNERCNFKQFDKTVGLDFKVGNIFVSSDCKKVKKVEKIDLLNAKIVFLHRKMKHKEKCSKKFYVILNKLRKLYKKVVKIRVNLLHTVSKILVTKYDNIAVESLRMSDIAHSVKYGSNVYGSSYYKFVKMLNYKVKGVVVYVNKWFPSSKLCCVCGNKKRKLKLSNRVYICDKCGNVKDRDLNASINIRNEGIRIMHEILELEYEF